MASIPEGTLLWQPSPERLKNARLTAYMAWLLKTRGLTFADYNALWQWSVDEIEAFWASIWEYYEIKASAPYKQVLKPGSTLDAPLVERIKARIRNDLSARHVPNDIFAIPEVPRTLNGKKLEVPIKRLLLGEPLEKVVNRDSMNNPGSLAWFVEFAVRRAAVAAVGN